MWPILAAACGILGLAAIGLATALLRSRRALRRARVETAAVHAAAQRSDRDSQRNAAILGSALDGFFVLDEQYRFREANDAFCRMLGYSAAELGRIRMSDLEVTRPASRAPSAHLRTGLNYISTAHRHKDGRIVQLETCINVLRDGSQKILVGFARDVTERCRAEEALRHSEKQYRDLVETSHDLIWAIDTDCRWTFVNNAARRIYGCAPEELIGRPIAEVFAPQRAADELAVFHEILRGTERFQHETVQVRRDGRPVVLSLNAIPVYDDARNIIGATGTAADVTEQKVSEERMRAANERFRTLVERMPLGYCVWDREGRISDWNPAAAEIFGWPRADALGRRLSDLAIAAESRGRFADAAARLWSSGAPGAFVMPGQRRDDAPIQCEWFNTVVHDGGGLDGGAGSLAASIIRDVSERERLEAALRQSQKLEALGVLAGGIAHDFNNLLVGMLGNAALALDGADDAATVRRHVEKVVTGCRRAAELTNRMLAYAGRSTCEPRAIDLNAVVREVTDLAGSSIPDGVALELDLTDELPPVVGDPVQTQQIAMNLVINAAEAIGQAPGRIRVETRSATLSRREEGSARGFSLTPPTRDGDRYAIEYGAHAPGEYVTIAVDDTGCGMSPETLGRMFEPFFTTKFTGRGLGLSAMLGIVRAHSGRITVSSREGHGTRITVALPIGAAQRAPSGCAEAAPDAQADRPATLDGRGPGLTAPARPIDAPEPLAASTVLVIDDEEDIRDVVQAILRARGVQVLLAESGRRGVELFREHAARVDAVLLDIQMPGMTGGAVLEELRALRPDVRVILSSGLSDPPAAPRLGSRVTFLRKPFTASALLERVGLRPIRVASVSERV